MSKLNNAQEQQIRALLNAVMNDNIVLVRSFAGDKAGSYVLSKNVNRIIERKPELSKTAISMMLFPAIKWMLQAKDIEVLIEACNTLQETDADSSDVKRLKDLQYWLSPYVDGKRLHFANREKYFNRCEELVSLIEDARQELSFETGYTPAMGDVYDCFLDPQKLPYNNRHKIMQYCERCIVATHEMFGSTIDALYEKLVTPADIDGVEEASLYHNVPQLLTEYARLLWRAGRSRDPVMRMLATASIEELNEKNKKTPERTYSEAYILIEYIKIVRGAIEMLKTFPGGEAYHEIIVAMVEGKKDNKRDAEIARQLGMSPGPYSAKKAHAIGVFGCILWGCDINNLLNCLIDHRV